MARRRYISTKISTDPAINKLFIDRDVGEFAALLYTWMIPHTEDTAEITGDPEELLLLVVPGARQRGTEDIIKALELIQKSD